MDGATEVAVWRAKYEMLARGLGITHEVDAAITEQAKELVKAAYELSVNSSMTVLEALYALLEAQQRLAAERRA